MPVKTWKPTDTSGDFQFLIGKQDFPGIEIAAGKRVWSSGLSEGVTSVEINNGKLTLVVLPTRGMGIQRVVPAGDPELKTIGWQSPVRGPVHPAFVNLGEPSGLGWLDGFDEFFVRCGLESNGAPDFDPKTGRLLYPLHGRIANRPAHDVLARMGFEDAPEGMSLKETSPLDCEFVQCQWMASSPGVTA